MYVNNAEETIEMPYIKVNQASFGNSAADEETPETKARSETKAQPESEVQSGTEMRSAKVQPIITLKPLAQTRATVSDTVLYEVNVRFTLDIESVNAKTENKQTLAFSVNYLGAVINTTEVPDPDPEPEPEPELVEVEYQTDYVWEEAHDNLPLLYYAIVYRKRHYRHSDGRKEVLTDKFVDSGHPGEVYCYIDVRDDNPFEITRTKERNDSIWISTVDTKVDNVADFTVTNDIKKTNPGAWDTYVISKLYSEDLSLQENVNTSQDYTETSLQNGWYFYCCNHCLYTYVRLDGVSYFTHYNDSRMYDQFLAIDGKIIDFLEHTPKREFNQYVEDISEGGTGKRIVGECTTFFLGRTFYTKTILNMYNK